MLRTSTKGAIYLNMGRKPTSAMFLKFLTVIPVLKGALAPTIFVTKQLGITCSKVR